MRRWMRIACLLLSFSAIADRSVARAGPNAATGPTVIAMLCKGAVRLPPGRLYASLTEVSFSSHALFHLLAMSGVDRLGRAFPAFSEADTVVVNRHGVRVNQIDLSRIVTIHLPEGADEHAFLHRLSGMEGVVYAEPIGAPHFCASFPNDSLFVSGDQWSLNNFGQLGGTYGADIEAPAAWELSKGTASVPIGIIDNGVLDTHPDLQGKVSGDQTWSSGGPSPGHGFLVAGVAGAVVNNRTGISGVDWNAPLISDDITDDHNANNTFYVGNALVTAVNRGARVLNNSYTMLNRFGTAVDTSVTLGVAFANMYEQDIVVVAAMGNDNAGAPQYPAAYPQMGIIAVGATDRGDNVWYRSNYGSHIDVAAPGVDIISTSPFADQYETQSGTSFAAPMVSGIAALILSLRPDLDNDDVQGLIRASTDKKPTGGWNQTIGTGRVNARRALEYTSTTRLQRGIGTASTTYQQDGSINGRFLGVTGLREDITYQADRYFVFQNITFPTPFRSVPVVWGRGASGTGTVGGAYYAEDIFVGNTPYFGQSYCEPVPETVNNVNGCTMRTFTYKVYDGSVQGFRWVPVDPTMVPTLVRCAWSAVDTTSIGVPDITKSYYVPQSGSVATPTEGAAAVKYFWTCPNNDSYQMRTFNARIKVVVQDAAGNAIPGIAAGDIYILFNGGTAAQGFAAQGADSVIANRVYNPFAACPDSKVIPADAPTDVNGVTYITFAGATPGSPGVASRDSTRKWGHYDAAPPVYVLGLKLTGRQTSAGTDPYTLTIRNVDTVGGLTTASNAGELVNSLDISPVQADATTHDYNYWEDFNGDGHVDSIDLSTVKGHNLHSCNTPSR